MYREISNQPYCYVSLESSLEVTIKYGIIDRLFTTRSLSRVLLVIANALDCNRPLCRIPLSRAAIKALTSERVIISCKCKNTCNTRRCRYFKEGKRCSVHCHYDYGFLASLGDRTEIALILREEALGL